MSLERDVLWRPRALPALSPGPIGTRFLLPERPALVVCAFARLTRIVMKLYNL
jgi:hypothetical protein